VTVADTPAETPADEAAPAADPLEPPRRSRWPMACAALFLVALGLAALAATQRSALEGERGDRRQIEQVSGEVATALLTYDYQHLDVSRDRVLQRSTGKFRKEYEAAFESSLKTLLTETKATSRGTVKDIYLSRVEDGTASALVVANAVADGTAGKRVTVDSYFRLDLVKVGGRWRVDGVTDLTFGGSGETVTSPSTTTPSK
jgi:Mce-associated membrane protein